MWTHTQLTAPRVIRFVCCQRWGWGTGLANQILVKIIENKGATRPTSEPVGRWPTKRADAMETVGDAGGTATTVQTNVVASANNEANIPGGAMDVDPHNFFFQ